MENISFEMVRDTIAYHLAANDLMMETIMDQNKLLNDFKKGSVNETMEMMTEKVEGVQVVAALIKKKDLHLLSKFGVNAKTAKNELEKYTEVAMRKLEQEAIDKMSLTTPSTTNQSAEQHVHAKTKVPDKGVKVREKRNGLY